MQEINDLLGVRTQVRLDPKAIVHEYQGDAATVRSDVFANSTPADYAKRLKAAKFLKKRKFVDVPSAQTRLLMDYGAQKESHFLAESADFLERVLYRREGAPPLELRRKEWQLKQLVKGLAVSFSQRQGYYSAVIDGLALPQLCDLISVVSRPLASLKLAPTLLHSFTLALSEAALRQPALKNSTGGRAVVRWVCQRVRDFRAYLQSSDPERSSVTLLMQNLRRYSLIRVLLSETEVPGGLLDDHRDWEEQLLSKLEAVVEEVGVSELEGRRVVDKLANVRAVLQFAAAEEIELPLTLLDKLLISVRSGVEWLLAGRRDEDSGVFACEIEAFFGREFCSDVIKVVFMSGEATVDLQAVLAFLWGKFYGAPLDEQAIQGMFLLVNVTTRYKCTAIVQEHEAAVSDLLCRSVEAIVREGYPALRKKEVIDFLREQAALLLHDARRHQLVELIARRFPQHS